ncbi:MAG TPA: hypothetical protein VMF86_03325 [Stellaceae bacterium]|nr:hypothetical protein [Stellaceae bacterium]
MTDILLVEPDDDFRLFLQLAIAGAGYHTRIAGSFAEASEILSDSVPIDVVVTAAKLPDGSGSRSCD